MIVHGEKQNQPQGPSTRRKRHTSLGMTIVVGAALPREDRESDRGFAKSFSRPYGTFDYYCSCPSTEVPGYFHGVPMARVRDAPSLRMTDRRTFPTFYSENFPAVLLVSSTACRIRERNFKSHRFEICDSTDFSLPNPQFARQRLEPGVIRVHNRTCSGP